jgi:hypothetical protein
MIASDEAVTAAAEAIEDAAMRWLGRDLGTLHRNEIVAEGLAAAVPHLERQIRESIAGEIEADTTRPDDEPYRWWYFWSWNRGFHAGWNSRGEVAARTARGSSS